jgi:hypothetical protein
MSVQSIEIDWSLEISRVPYLHSCVPSLECWVTVWSSYDEETNPDSISLSERDSLAFYTWCCDFGLYIYSQRARDVTSDVDNRISFCLANVVLASLSLLAFIQ